MEDLIELQDMAIDVEYCITPEEIVDSVFCTNKISVSFGCK